MAASALGLSFQVPQDVHRLVVTASWGRYAPAKSDVQVTEQGSPRTVWRRTPGGGTVELDAARAGPSAVRQMRADAGGVGVRTACERLVASTFDTEDHLVFAGALLATLHPNPRSAALDVVWSGPDSHAATGRLTSAVVVDLIGGAETDIVLVGYAVHNERSVSRALDDAQSRGVRITLILERHADNSRYTGTPVPFPGLVATRLSWPAVRPAGGSLHAKILLIDGVSALIGSANVTDAAFARNIECGLLVRGGPEPAAIGSHLRRLQEGGTLESAD